MRGGRWLGASYGRDREGNREEEKERKRGRRYCLRGGGVLQVLRVLGFENPEVAERWRSGIWAGVITWNTQSEQGY